MTNTTDITIDSLAETIEAGELGPLYLVSGDRVLAEPAAMRLGTAIAKQVGCEVEITKRPAELSPLLADLKTFSLFSTGKVVVAVETAVLADSKAAADLIDEALQAPPVQLNDEVVLTDKERRAAGCLLQTIRLFQLDPNQGNPTDLISQLPDWVLQGGKRSESRRRRGKGQVADARARLADLLKAARAADLHGWAETELGELASIAHRGLPQGHALVLAESAVGAKHPLLEVLRAQGRFADVGRVEAGRGGEWQGLELLAVELRQETGVGIAPAALKELARRTIQRVDSRRSSGSATVDPETTARLAAEYRKLATLASAGKIERELVESVVEDRGEEDAWKTLDAIGAGHAEEALLRVRRMMAGADDPISARLSFFSLLAGFVRQLTAISELMDSLDAPKRAMSYPAFKSQLAPQLQAELPGGGANPLAGLHPYRLYRAYAAVSGVPSQRLARLPAEILQAELRLKGDSGQPEAALSELVCDVALAVRRPN